jgi:hypothetical protein
VLPAIDQGFVANVVIRQRLSHAPAYYKNVPVKLSYFDNNLNRIDEVVNVSGPCTSHSSPVLVNEPVFIAVDFDENIEDAITDEWRIVADTGIYDFRTAKLVLTVKHAADSNLVRVEHNWIRPEPMRTKVAGLHLHDKRYWTFDGVIHNGFTADAKLVYDGTDSTFDATFITNTEDSLMIMYRPNDDSEWVRADSFIINTQGNIHDKKGYATVYGVKKGQYCFAIWNTALPDTTAADAACIYTSIEPVKNNETDFNIYPNPTDGTITLIFNKGQYEKLTITDIAGKQVLMHKVQPYESQTDFNIKQLPAGTYVVTLWSISGEQISKKIIKQ